MEKNTKKTEEREELPKKPESLISEEERKNPYEIGPDVAGGVPPEFV